MGKRYSRGTGLLSTDLVDEVTRVIGALSLLAACKIGSGGGPTRARQRLARSGIGARNARPASGRGSSSAQGPLKKAKHFGDRLRLGLAVIWVALLLSILAYAELKGEAGLAEFEAIGLRGVTE